MTISLIIHPMHTDDVAILAEYWYDKMALLQHYNHHINLASDAQSAWQQSAYRWLSEYPELCFSAYSDDNLLGGIVGAIQPNEIGLLPSQIGVIRALTLDLHAPQGQKGSGKALLTTLQTHLRQRDILQLHVQHWHGWSVETAFWQMMGVKTYYENYRIDLT